jgi:hypothetical protein
MSVQSTIDIGRSLLREALRWALPRLAIYVFGVLGAVFAFTIWAVITPMSGPASRSKRRQKWSNMADFNKRRRWRGPALGGRLTAGGTVLLHRA